MKRIAIIGISGSGKSIFARKLSEKLNIPLIHLDKEFYNSDWSEKFSKENWKKFHEKLIDKNEWIIDGTYKSTMPQRLEKADTILYFDIPRWKPFIRVFKRALLKKGQALDKPTGMKERVSFELVKFMLTFPQKEVENIINHSNAKKYVFKSNEAADKFLESLGTDS